jgi:hypothetical protein
MRRSKVGNKRLNLKSNLIKGMRIAALGIALWGLSLFWPEINRFLTEAVIIKVVLGLGLVILVYILSQYLGWPHDHHGTRHFTTNITTRLRNSPS